jgi:folylpolyglutamate synthase/dihydropteroate synthase
VGMGGLLDATNILNNQVVSVIGKIAKDHEAFLGNTLAEIAKHKAGILKPGVPYIVNPENEFQVQAVIDDYAKEIGAGPRLSLETERMKEKLFMSDDWRFFAKPLPAFQRDNAVMAIVAAMEAAKGFGKMYWDMIGDELGKKRFESIPGRLQELPVVPVFGSVTDVGRTIVVDGAHNVDAAKGLSYFVQRKCRKKWLDGKPPPTEDGWPVTWVLAMTEGKDARHYLERLLQPGDTVITTAYGPVDGMPWVKPIDPQRLLDKALQIPGVTGFAMPQQGVLRALLAAKSFTHHDHPIVLTGSLYLIGDFYRELQDNNNRKFWYKNDFLDMRNHMYDLGREEQERVQLFLRGQDLSQLKHPQSTTPVSPTNRLNRLTSEIEDLGRKLDLITIEEKQVEQKHPVIQPSSIADVKWTDVEGAKTWPSTDNPPPSDRPHASKFKELRERTKSLKEETKSSPIRMFPAKWSKGDYVIKPSNVDAEPKIRMHFKDDEGADRRNFRRPDFVAKKKWES